MMESDVTGPQPKPTPNGRRSITAIVIEDLQRRDAAGRIKYGTTLQPFNGRKALVDAYQEALDLCQYLRQKIEEETNPTGHQTVEIHPPAESIAEEAHRLVHGARQGDYGAPIDDFTRTGRIWGAILGIADVPPEKVGLCMVGVKLSRECNKPKRDNRVDGAGYFATVDLVEQAKASRPTKP
jgi:hypothetical protein